MTRPALLARLRARAMNATTRAKQVFWKRSLERNRRSYVSETVTLDGVPTMRGLRLLLVYAREHGWAGKLNSSDRRKGVAETYGHQSQAALYAGFVAGRPGFLPANPPGFSSHELRSDGTALFGERGRVLPWFQLGLDVSDDGTLVRVLADLGVRATHPYNSAAEAHHVNVTGDPTAVLVRLGLI